MHRLGINWFLKAFYKQILLYSALHPTEHLEKILEPYLEGFAHLFNGMVLSLVLQQAFASELHGCLQKAAVFLKKVFVVKLATRLLF